MLTLCGFSASNYYNKVKLALLEKGVPFTEEQIFPSSNEDYLKLTPMGKVPFLRTEGATLSESQPIVDYLEEIHPQPLLYPGTPLGRAKCRELIQVIELYLEWPARRLYPQAFFGGSVSEETRTEVARVLDSDYVRTARSKGLRERAVIYGHAMKNAMLPLITVTGLRLGTLLHGSVVTETVFTWPGIGRLMIESISARDYPVVQVIVPISALVFVASNFMVDVFYAYADPRVRLGTK